MVGFVLTITVETPFLRLEKLMFEGLRKRDTDLNEVVVNIPKGDRPITIWNYRLAKDVSKIL